MHWHFITNALCRFTVISVRYKRGNVSRNGLTTIRDDGSLHGETRVSKHFELFTRRAEHHREAKQTYYTNPSNCWLQWQKKSNKRQGYLQDYCLFVLLIFCLLSNLCCSLYDLSVDANMSLLVFWEGKFCISDKTLKEKKKLVFWGWWTCHVMWHHMEYRMNACFAFGPLKWNFLVVCVF